MNKILIALIATLSAINVYGATINLGLELSGLEPMKGQHYEGWNIIDGKAVSTGRFAIKKSGKIYQVNSKGKKLRRVGKHGVANFEVDVQHLKASVFVLTIEPNDDRDNGPSKIHIIGGDYSNNVADLAVEHGSSLQTDFSMASGKYILAAPTGGEFNQGIWFLNPESGTSGLELPALPEGFVYEGWIVNTKNGKKFSTGLFRNSDKADSDGAGRFAGPLKLDFPNVPGQDIVNTRVVLNDGIHAAVVSVEPYPDFDPAPFAIKVLKSDISSDSMGMTAIDFDNIVHNTLPHGSVHLH